LWSDRSQIALRLLARGDVPIDRAFWAARLDAAIGYRRSLRIDATAYRIVHAEGDGLPSLVVDRYGDVLVVQALSQGMDRCLPEILGLLIERLSPAGVLLRHDVRARSLEGLPRTVEVVHGRVPERVVVREGEVELEADLWRGQKTGLYLDQRENHLALREYARGRVFDGFAYDGGFALQVAAAGAEVLAVDLSEEAVARLRRNAERNGLAARVEARVGNVFDVLREADRAGERFDGIVLDPPAFAPSRSTVDKALAGYKEINLRALKRLNPGGILATCTCSYHVDDPAFANMLLEAALDAKTTVTLLEARTQARDHPIRLGVPETRYLRCFLLSATPSGVASERRTVEKA
jgi:23S rRNA (cytosine1962-C5)-methyltransferase